MPEFKASVDVYSSQYRGPFKSLYILGHSASVIFILVDFISVMTIPLIGILFRESTEDCFRNLSFSTFLSCVTVMLIASHGGYPASQNINRRRISLAIKCFYAASVAMLLTSFLFGHTHIFTQRWTSVNLIITPFILGFGRSTLVGKLANRPDRPSTNGPLVVCYDHYPPDLPRALSDQRISNQISGILYLGKQPKSLHKWPILSDTKSLLKIIKTGRVQDIVFIHHPESDVFSAIARQDLLSDLLTYPARIWFAFDIDSNLPNMLKKISGSCFIVPIVTESFVSSLNLTKRMFDLIGGIIMLILLFPLLLATAAFVKASGPGPVVFRQNRTGAHGQQFTVFKFRTMAYEPNKFFSQAQRNDPRVTKIGRLLRRSSIDELLQLVNVIKGDMSLVGPRPHSPETQVEGINFEAAVQMYRLRHRVKPGITGLAQVRGLRGETSAINMLEQRLASDLEYIQSWSLWLDISIMFRTLPMMMAQTNAC